MVVIRQIEPGSLGCRAGFRAGDGIRTINGHSIQDVIDFQIQSAEELLHIEVERDGEVYEVEVERFPGESFGLTLEEMRLRQCNNKCVFCFIHQMPEGMRSSLYFEDDDYRLSFLHGSYVTLTNIKERDIDRIIEQHLSPQYLSVHATTPSLRQKMLGRRLPVDILERIGKLADKGIEMHTQVVLCPGWNDGEHLHQTVHDLSAYYPAMRSVALVPVGLTKFRQNLPRLGPVTPRLAHHYIAQADDWGEIFQRNLGERLVYAADELFLLTGQYPPAASYYDAFPQLENGIGMVRSFLDQWERDKKQLPASLPQPIRLALVTGQLATFFMAPVVAELNQIPGLQVDLLTVENDFFGHGITVSGLLSGEDILKHIRRGPWDRVLLPPNCINGEGLTLDDKTVPALQEAAGVPLAVGDYNLAAGLRDLLVEARVEHTGTGRQLPELGYYVGRKK